MSDPRATLLPAFTEAIARRDFAVPAYPAAALRLRRLIASDNYGVAQVCDVIAADPVLAATVLRLANSSVYRLEGSPITALGRAIHRIGVRSLATVATAAGVGAQACARGPLMDLKFAVWRRSVTTALICQKLAAARDLDPEEAFLAGLLHGFGRTVAAACLEKLLGTNAPSRPLSPAEWFAMIDEHRATLAQLVAERWELPQELASAIGAAPGSDLALARLLETADDVARAIDQNLPLEGLNLHDREKTLLIEFSRGLPDAIAALVDVPAGNRPPPPSAVAKPVTTLKGEVRDAELLVTDLRGRAASALRATALSADGMRMLSDRPMQEGSLVHVNVAREPKPLKIWVSVMLSAPEGGAFRVEVQLFTPSRELRAEWLELFQVGSAGHPAAS